MQMTVVWLDLFEQRALVVLPGFFLEIAFWSPFLMVGYSAQPRCSEEGLCPASTLCHRLCGLPKGSLAPSEEWIGGGMGGGVGKRGRTGGGT